MMWQTMLLEEVFYHSTFLTWLIFFNSVTILPLLMLPRRVFSTLAYVPSNEGRLNVSVKFCLIGTKDSYSLSIVGARVAWFLDDGLIGSSTVFWSGINGCQCAVFGNDFSDSWLVFFLGLPSLGLPSLGIPSLFFVLSTTPPIWTLSFIHLHIIDSCFRKINRGSLHILCRLCIFLRIRSCYFFAIK